MIFEKEYGNPHTNAQGCHPLYAAVAHVSPRSDTYCHQVVCHDLNDLKGHLPYKIFKEIQVTAAWRKLMDEWRVQTETDCLDIEAFKKLLRD
jgi:hypothetical protein